MELDDVAEKARRNLMMVSTGIIAVWALGIPLDGKLVGAVNLNEVQPWRAWTCAAVVLIYVYLRFRLSPSVSKARNEYYVLKAGEAHQRNEQYAFDQYDAFAASKRSRLEFQLGAPPKDGFIPGKSVRGFEVVWQAPTRSGLRGRLSYGWEFPELRGGPYQFYGEADFLIPRWWLMQQTILEHVLRLKKLTWAGLEVTLPTALTIAALAVCLIKIAVSVYYEFPFVRQLLSA